MNNRVVKIGFFEAVFFSLLFISTAAANTTTQYQTTIQEKLIYITLCLEFFFIISHKVCSRVSYAFFNNRRGR
jgi:hypothetical protein